MTADLPDEEAETVTITSGAGTNYRSYSSFNEWLGCGMKWKLTRLDGNKEVPGWYLAGGSAVHTATERYDQALWDQQTQDSQPPF